ncbi:MAG: MinD/ParA family protein [Selenomonadaceae bacterium]|jgi:flagellar biosynthesis protein FlhG
MNDQAANLRKLIENKQVYEQASIIPAIQQLKPQASPARIIAVTSGKGGVGKTNLTVNLAIALSLAGKRVLIIDADLGMANVDVVMGAMSKYNLMHLLQDDVSLVDIVMQGPCGVKFVSGGSGLEQMANLSVQDRSKLMAKLYECEQMADIILVDTGAGLSHNVLDFIVAADEVILLTTPEPTAMTDAYAVLKAYSMYASNKDIKLVVNRIYDEAEARDVVLKLVRTADRFLKLPLKVLGNIYEDRNMMNAVKKQRPLLSAYPDTVSAKCIRAIAESLLHGNSVKVHRGWKAFLQRFLVFSR